RQASVVWVALVGGLARRRVERVQHLGRRWQVGIAHREADDVHTRRAKIGDLAGILSKVVGWQTLEALRKVHGAVLLLQVVWEETATDAIQYSRGRRLCQEPRRGLQLARSCITAGGVWRTCQPPAADHSGAV